MNLQASKEFLRCLGLTQFDGRRTGWLTGPCPLRPWRHPDGSGNGSFGLKLGEGRVFCKCFSCDYHGSPMDLVYDLRHLNKQNPSGKTYELGKALAILESNPATLIEEGIPSIDELTYGQAQDFEFPEEWLAEFEPAYAEGHVHPYLNSRKGGPVPYEVAKALDLRYDNMRSRVCFPVRDFHGKLRGLHGRSIHDHVELKYLMYTLPDPQNPDIKRSNPAVWLGEAWVDPERPIVVTESVFDLARVFQVYRNVICPLMASLNEAKMKRLVGAQTIVTMFDADKAGNMARDKLVARFPDVEFFHAKLPNVGDDPGAMTVESVATILQEFVELDPLLLAQPTVGASL